MFKNLNIRHRVEERLNDRKKTKILQTYIAQNQSFVQIEIGEFVWVYETASISLFLALSRI